MEYMTLKQASEQWGITPRMINHHCTNGRISGAVKIASVWLIPKDAERPVDKRYKSNASKDGEDQ